MEANTSSATSKLNSLKVLLKSEPKVISFIQRVLNSANHHHQKELKGAFTTEMLNYLHLRSSELLLQPDHPYDPQAILNFLDLLSLFPTSSPDIKDLLNASFPNI